MEHSFYTVEEVKRKKVINCGLIEFSKQGYDRSSLNSILKSSGVSKGFFYHYFKDKHEFYEFLFQFGIHYVVKKLNDEQVLKEQDYIKRLQVQATHKIVLALEYPGLFTFLGAYYKTMDPKDYLDLTNSLSGNFTDRFLNENVDYSLFRDDIPRDVALKVVGRYSSQIHSEIEQLGLTDMTEIFTYYQSQLEDIRLIMYKKGQ